MKLFRISAIDKGSVRVQVVIDKTTGKMSLKIIDHNGGAKCESKSNSFDQKLLNFLERAPVNGFGQSMSDVDDKLTTEGQLAKLDLPAIENFEENDETEDKGKKSSDLVFKQDEQEKQKQGLGFGV